ncbi:response regulator [Paraclostridium ghonii]|uniref:response regulator n=1 Tax=Paraclostridium ghonii TaxID=29358 RepID=UPI00202CD009|nr:response regulator [Paeniclostridium ghonii]MCM0165343.1 response regulator [Paeniclostridium ghonii]
MFTILIIEDDDTIAFGVKTFLSKNNYRVIHGKDLKEGKELFKTDIDLILIDLNLPDGNVEFVVGTC